MNLEVRPLEIYALAGNVSTLVEVNSLTPVGGSGGAGLTLDALKFDYLCWVVSK